MSKGKRVLALACKAMDTKLSKGLNPSRQSIESNLEFVCFILFDSDLKIDTRSVVKELLASNHKVTIITGDRSVNPPGIDFHVAA
tara:strand:+ start:282 stop:536 length:255 start_codon:yes stop_codon:yes gene_type:complete